MEWSPVAIGVAVLVALNCLVTLRIALTGGLTGTQKLLQAALVWGVPFLGMLLVYHFHQADGAPRGPAEPPFGGGAGSGPPGTA
jgi:hypothetical protein